MVRRFRGERRPGRRTEPASWREKAIARHDSSVPETRYAPSASPRNSGLGCAPIGFLPRNTRTAARFRGGASARVGESTYEIDFIIMISGKCGNHLNEIGLVAAGAIGPAAEGNGEQGTGNGDQAPGYRPNDSPPHRWPTPPPRGTPGVNPVGNTWRAPHHQSRAGFKSGPTASRPSDSCTGQP